MAMLSESVILGCINGLATISWPIQIINAFAYVFSIYDTGSTSKTISPNVDCGFGLSGCNLKLASSVYDPNRHCLNNVIFGPHK